MLKKNKPWWPSIFASSLLVLASTLVLIGCDRGASDQIGAARKFSDAVVRNNAKARDSMIATAKFKAFFDNEYVSHDMRLWFGTFYDYQQQHFRGTTSADVDVDLKPDLQGALIDTTEIEETGMVKVKQPDSTGIEPAYFWMVRQRGKPWRVAVVTKGETRVNFK